MTRWYLFIGKGGSKCVTVSWRQMKGPAGMNRQSILQRRGPKTWRGQRKNICRHSQYYETANRTSSSRVEGKKKKNQFKYVRAEKAERGRETENVLGSYGSLWRTVVGGRAHLTWRLESDADRFGLLPSDVTRLPTHGRFYILFYFDS